MSKEAFDEISVLSAIYCEKGEFELLEESREFCWMHYSILSVITIDLKKNYPCFFSSLLNIKCNDRHCFRQNTSVTTVNGCLYCFTVKLW